MKRFNETMERVVKTEDYALIKAFRPGLKSTHFAMKLFNKKPKNLVDIMRLAYEAMEVEEMLEEKFRVQSLEEQ